MYFLLFFNIIVILFLALVIKLTYVYIKKTIYWNGYKIKIFTPDKITLDIIDEIKTISINSVNTIPNNPIFNNENKNNKHLMIVYKNNKPIGFNIMFNYKCKEFNCLHIGLMLIDKNYQGREIKNFTFFNIIYYLVANYPDNVYVSNLGRASTTFKLFNKLVDNSYPNFMCDDNGGINNDIYKSIFIYFFNNFKEDTQISKNATVNIEKFIIYNGNDSNGGGSDYLILNKNKNFTMSKNEKYNKIFYSNLNDLDDLFCIGKINIFNIFTLIKKYLFD